MEEEHISELPEACISNILSFISPLDACTSSLVSSAFKSAIDSDVVWEKFLPADYKDIVARSVTLMDLNGFGSKKKLYFRLCDEPVLIDSGSMIFSLEKKSGKKCFMIGARELKISSGDAASYWAWIFLPESRFAEVAQLLSVCTLYITGTVDTRMLSTKTTYLVYIVVKFRMEFRMEFRDDTHGLDHRATEVSVYFRNGTGSASGTRTAYLDPSLRDRYEWRACGTGFVLGPVSSSNARGQYLRARKDGWMEVVMGEFYNDDGGGWVEVILDANQGSLWKSGLIVQGIEVRPKEN